MTISVPTAMRDRWRDRAEPPVGRGTVYWHVLMRDHPRVVGAADEVQDRLVDFSGLHRTPREWFHMTVYVPGPAEEIGPDQLRALLSRTQGAVRGIRPVPVTTSKILYHPEAIMLAIEPADQLRSVAQAVAKATQEVVGPQQRAAERIASWVPHVTVAYSTAVQNSAPIVDAVGTCMPPRTALIERMSLVIQWGPERDWDWEVVGEIRLGGIDTNTR